MKIGTITFWDTEENYGQVLQCYALISFLRSLGHETVLVKTCGDLGSRRTLKQKAYTFLHLLSHPRSFVNSCLTKSDRKGIPSGQVVTRGFSQFRDKYVPSTEKVYRFDELMSCSLGFDAMICGSDQIWSAISPVMFLQLPGRYKRISYAASFGGIKINNKLDRKQVKTWLESFDFISVRETEGVEICNGLGVDASLFPDPTLLLEREEYEMIARDGKRCDEEPYLFLYLLGNRTEFDVQEVYSFAERNGLKVKYVASQGREDGYEKLYPSIPEWLIMIRDAKYVITNSFHGTVFSLLFNTPFLTIPLSGSVSRMNGRIVDLLSKYHLESRLFSGDISVVKEGIDFSCFNSAKKQDSTSVKKIMKELL